MKKQTIVIFILLVIIVIAVAVAVSQNVQKQRELSNYNNQYEQYKDVEVYGTDVATLINKAVDNNEKNEVSKDENGYYIANNTNSVKIYLKLETEGDNYPMERIVKLGMTEFVKNFNLETFTCTKINYHNETGKVSEVYLEVK